MLTRESKHSTQCTAIMGKSIELNQTFEDGTAEYKLCGGGVETLIWSIGGVIQSLTAPNKDGELADVVLGYDTPKDYIDGQCWLAGLIGRYGNRIAEGKFSLDGVDYQLPVNVGPNYCHGGFVGYHQRHWRHGIVDGKLELSLTSPDGEEGFPGTVEAKVTYEMTDKAELVVNYEATTDKPSIVNLGNHAYWNLQGHNHGDIFSHKVQLYSNERTPMDETRIPYGNIESVEGTQYDLREGKMMSEEFLNSVGNDVMKGFDDNFVVPGNEGTKRRFGRFSAGGRVMEVSTTQPGFSFYTAYFLDCPNGKSGSHYKRYGAFIPYTQSYPDSPNKANFPKVVLRPGETYSESTTYKFSTE